MRFAQSWMSSNAKWKPNRPNLEVTTFTRSPVTQQGVHDGADSTPLLCLIRRSDQPEVQQHTPVADEPEVQPFLKPAPSGERNTRAIPQDVKIEVAVRDGGRCRQCGSNKELHFDHVIPWSKGGPNTVDNIQLLCGTCNRRKGADDIPAELPPSPYRQPWRSPAADTRPPQPPAPTSHHRPCLICPSGTGSRPARFAGCCQHSILARLAPATVSPLSGRRGSGMRYAHTQLEAGAARHVNRAGELMPRGMVGLLAAVAAAMAVLDPLAHGYPAWLVLAIVAAATFLVGYVTAPDPALPPAPTLALPGPKKPSCSFSLDFSREQHLAVRRAPFGPGLWPGPRRQARCR